MDDYFTNTDSRGVQKSIETHNKTKEEQKDRGITFWTSDISPEKFAADKKTDVYNKNKFYLVVYVWKHYKDKNWNYSECCIDIHPLQWLVKARENLYKNHKEICGESNGKEQKVYLISWNEIPFSIYKKYKNKVGYY